MVHSLRVSAETFATRSRASRLRKARLAQFEEKVNLCVLDATWQSEGSASLS